jgi:DNA invertase Pin-like site-specific DNA recombinase
MRLFGYVRVSSREQEQGYSIDAQIKKLHEFCGHRGHEIVRLFREVETAKKAGRPVFNEMIALVRKDATVEGVVCHKVDRLCRNFKDFVTVDELGKRLVFVEEEFAPTAAGKLTFGMKVLLAKHYIDNLSDEVKKGMAEKVEQGGVPWHAPWGYRNVDAPHSVEPVLDRAAVVRQLFEWYATGRESLETVRRRFIEAGFVYSPSRARPSRRAIECILKNRFYTGFFDFLGKTYKGSYEPIIPVELFERVQAAFGGRANGSGRRGLPITYRGLFVCGNCGCSITGEVKKGKYTYYRCSRMRGPCREPAIREEALEAQITETLQPLALDEELLALAKDAWLERRGEARERAAAERAALEARSAKLREFVDRSYEDKLEGRIAEDFWEKKTATWKAELAAIERRLAADGARRDDAATVIRVLELAKELPGVWLTRKGAERRGVVEIVYSNSTLVAGSLVPKWRRPFDLLVKRPSSERWWGRLDSNCYGFGREHPANDRSSAAQAALRGWRSLARDGHRVVTRELHAAERADRAAPVRLPDAELRPRREPSGDKASSHTPSGRPAKARRMRTLGPRRLGPRRLSAAAPQSPKEPPVRSGGWSAPAGSSRRRAPRGRSPAAGGRRAGRRSRPSTRRGGA